jgi:hypothetical protein
MLADNAEVRIMLVPRKQVQSFALPTAIEGKKQSMEDAVLLE